MRLAGLSLLSFSGMFLPKNRWRIFTYHSLDDSGSCVSIHPDVFRRQMAYLKLNGIKGVSLDHYIRVYKASPQKIADFAAITFDDGFDNFYSAGLDILLEYGFAATVFIPSAYVGKICTWEKKRGVPRQKLMAWSDIYQCMKNDIEIGSHTKNHLRLSLTDRKRAREEIEVSKKEIENHLGIEVSSFCYPYGKYDAAVTELVEKAGYRQAVTCNFSFKRNRIDLYELPRLGMNRVDPDDHKSQYLYFKAGVYGMLPFYNRFKMSIKSFVNR
jgi:peptidoglycan/xylan/chitin deacetylase (PgdA/CDA1 family)